MQSILTTFLIIHVLTGVTALLVGLIPMFSKKGGKLHNGAGRIYVWCMIAVAVTALLLCGLQPFKLMRLFLTGIAIFSFYLCFTGWRATKQKTGGPTTGDKGLTYGTLAVSLGMIGFGGYLLATEGADFFPIVFTFFGGLTFRFAWEDVRQLGRPVQKMHWFFQHFTRMGGSYIATFTAAVVTNGHRLPAGLPNWTGTALWIAPSVLGGLLIGRTVRYYKQKFGANALPASA